MAKMGKKNTMSGGGKVLAPGKGMKTGGTQTGLQHTTVTGGKKSGMQNTMNVAVSKGGKK